jgi:hypothetical protein
VKKPDNPLYHDQVTEEVKMKISFEPDGHSIQVVNTDASCVIGSIEATAKYRVRNAEGDTIAMVNSANDAIPALTAYFEKHSTWQRGSSIEYFKWTLHGLLQAKQEDGLWFVYRHASEPLMRDGEVATFATLQEAQRAADSHLLDDPKDRKSANGGLSWFAYERRPNSDAVGRS